MGNVTPQRNSEGAYTIGLTDSVPDPSSLSGGREWAKDCENAPGGEFERIPIGSMLTKIFDSLHYGTSSFGGFLQVSFSAGVSVTELKASSDL